MTKHSLPGISLINNAWLTEQLRTAGYTDATVTSIEQTPIGTGQMAKCLRLTLEVNSANPSVPRSLVAKIKSDSEESQKMGSMLPIYRREVEFYNRIQPHLSITVPHTYYSEIADDNVNFLILIEDLAPAEQGNQLIGCSPEVARKAAIELAGLHGPTWNNPDLANPESPLHVIALPEDHTRDIYVNSVEGFVDRHGEALEADQIDIIRQYATYLNRGGNPENLNLQAIIHHDYRLDNLLISDDQSDPNLTVVDWQTYTLGNPLDDVAYFLASSMLPEVRREVEEDILKEYHQTIVAMGVTDFSWDDCWQAYRYGSLYGFIMSIGAAMSVARTERGDEMFRLMASRHTRQAIDLKVDELFA